MEWKKLLCCCAVWIGLAIAGTARAGLVLEYDFNNPSVNSGTGTTANFAANGGSTDADLLGNSNGSNRPNLSLTYNAATGLNSGYDSRLQTGYLWLQPGTGGNLGQALGSANKNSSVDHLMSQYMNSPTFTSGSMVLFFKPNYSGVPTSRNTFFWTGSSNSSNNLLWLLNSDDAGGPALVRNSGVMASIPNFSYDANTWYMLGASFMPNTAANPQNVLYIRALTTGSVASSDVENTILLDGTTVMDGNNNVLLGRRGDTGVDDANADFAMFQLYNNPMTVADFDNLYIAMTPEPGSIGLLILGGGWYAMRRRARHA